MSRSPHDPGEPDDQLRALLGDAVDDLEPSDRLADIRAGAAAPTTDLDPGPKVTTMSNRRPWLYAATAAAVATAAVLAIVTFAGGSILGDDDGPEPAAASDTDTASGASSESAGSDAPRPGVKPEPPVAGEQAVPVYYTGDGPDGPVLFREFHGAPVSDGSDALLTAAREAVSGVPLDPDYRSDWPGVTVQQADLVDGVIAVDLDAAPERPGGLSEREARLAVQQVVYTVQGAAQERAPVRFAVDGGAVDEVLGVDTSEPVANAPVLDTLSRMSITAPYEGQEVSGSLEATGVNNSFEATVAWQVVDAGGTRVLEGAGIAEGYLGPRLFPWTVQVDVSGLDAGRYTFVASNDDPQGSGAATDSRTIVIR